MLGATFSRLTGWSQSYQTLPTRQGQSMSLQKPGKRGCQKQCDYEEIRRCPDRHQDLTVVLSLFRLGERRAPKAGATQLSSQADVGKGRWRGWTDLLGFLLWPLLCYPVKLGRLALPGVTERQGVCGASGWRPCRFCSNRSGVASIGESIRVMRKQNPLLGLPWWCSG